MSDRWLWLVLIFGAIVIAGISAWSRTAANHGIGVLNQQDPGASIQIAYTVARWVMDLAAVVVVGALASVALLTAPRGTEYGPLMTSRARRRMLLCSRWSLIWAIGAVACLVLSSAYDSGLSFSQLDSVSAWWNATTIAKESSYFLATTIGAAIVYVLARWTALWRNALALLLFACLSVWPCLLSSHQSSDIDHDIATGAIMVHVPAAMIWCGLLLWVYLEAHSSGTLRDGVCQRYRQVAQWCWLAVGSSGLILAGIMNPGWNIRDPYGRLLLVKALLFIAVVALGMVARMRAQRASRADLDPRRFLLIELGLLIASVGTGAALTTVTPATFNREASGLQTLIGFNVGHAPTWWRLIVDWRLEALMAAIAITLAVWYLRLLLRMRKAGHGWPLERTVAWFAGCLVIVIATCSGLGLYEPAMFSIHMASDALIQTIAPLLLALGGPFTLARHSVLAAPRTLPDTRHWIGALEGSALTRRLTQPLVVLALFQIVPFAIYFTSVFDVTTRFHWAHLCLSLYLLLSGFLFAWVAVGVDATPRPTPAIARLGILLASMPIAALFSGFVMSTKRELGNGLASANMYSSLALPWVHSLHADQRLGGLLSLIISEVAVVAALAVLLRRWWQYDEPVAEVGTR